MATAVTLVRDEMQELLLKRQPNPAAEVLLMFTDRLHGITSRYGPLHLDLVARMGKVPYPVLAKLRELLSALRSDDIEEQPGQALVSQRCGDEKTLYDHVQKTMPGWFHEQVQASVDELVTHHGYANPESEVLHQLVEILETVRNLYGVVDTETAAGVCNLPEKTVIKRLRRLLAASLPRDLLANPTETLALPGREGMGEQSNKPI